MQININSNNNTGTIDCEVYTYIKVLNIHTWIITVKLNTTKYIIHHQDLSMEVFKDP